MWERFQTTKECGTVKWLRLCSGGVPRIRCTNQSDHCSFSLMPDLSLPLVLDVYINRVKKKKNLRRNKRNEKEKAVRKLRSKSPWNHYVCGSHGPEIHAICVEKPKMVKKHSSKIHR